MIRLARKAVAQLRLLRADPEQFGRNVKQFTHPDAFLRGLLDVPEMPPLGAVPSSGPPALHVLLPSIARAGLTGGPNTALLIGALLAHDGVPVRFVSCDAPLAADTSWFWPHLERLAGRPGRPPGAALHDARAAPLPLGPDDLLLASFWTTAHQAAALLPRTRRDRFAYLIQDFEPGFYPWSSRYALAAQTLDLPFDALVNEATLADFLFDSRLGRFADPAFRDRCTVFEPAIDRTLFRPLPAEPGHPPRLLVYARPNNPRNLLGLAVEALRLAVATPAFAPAPGRGAWEFLAIGARGSLPDVPLGHGQVLREAPWADLAGYAALLARSNILLSPMLSPHTGYPALEMAACGGIAVTNSFGAKTAARLQALSPNIIAAEPTVPAFAAALAAAAARTRHDAPVDLPATWPDALAGVRRTVRALLAR